MTKVAKTLSSTHMSLADQILFACFRLKWQGFLWRAFAFQVEFTSPLGGRSNADARKSKTNADEEWGGRAVRNKRKIADRSTPELVSIMSSISSKAFAVYCDEVVRDTVEKSESIRKENESLEPFQSFLHSIQIHHGEDLLKEINLLDSDEQNEDTEYLAYSIVDARSFPYEQLPQFGVTVCGLQFSRSPFNAINNWTFPKLTLLHDAETPSACLVFHLLDTIRVTGVLTEFQGTLDNVQKLIDTNQFTLLYMNLGLVDVETGEPARVGLGDNDSTLDGAIFTIKTIEILKAAIEPAISCDIVAPSTATMDQIKELQTLVLANDSHEQLCKVTEQYKALVHRNAILKSCRSLVESVVVECPGGSPIRCNLDNGKELPDLDGGPIPLWRFEPLEEEKEEHCTIPISSIRTLQIKLGGIPWGMQTVKASFVRNHPFMVVTYGNGVSVFFCFDNSITASDLEEHGANLYRQVHDLVMFPRASECEWTMRLWSIQVPLYQVETHLHLLGVDTTANEDE